MPATRSQVKSLAVTGFSKVMLLDLVAFLDRAEKSAAAGGANAIRAAAQLRDALQRL